jgi:TonB family protein
LPRDAHAARGHVGDIVKSNVHDRIEAIAGAIALGEATDEERREYREHISACAACLRELGGEHEIERVASVVGAARDAEVWVPDMVHAVAARADYRRRILRVAGSVMASVIVVGLIANALVAKFNPNTTLQTPAVVTRAQIAQVQPLPVAVHAVRINAPAEQQRLIVTHNVVQMARAPVAPAPLAAAPARKQGTPELVSMVVHPAQPPASVQQKYPAWRTVARTTVTSLAETAPQSFTHNVEMLQFSHPQVREAAPIGGETALNPQPPMIAYSEGAQGTSAFEVLVDERGNPTKCVITKPAGFPVLDEAVCKAAMKIRYTPKMIDGRAVAGVYHDAFTFRYDNTPETAPTALP